MAITWNPSDKSAELTLSNGDLTVEHTGSTTDALIRATESKSSGKHYWEVTLDSGSRYVYIGIANSSAPTYNHVGDDSNGWGYYAQNGYKRHSAASVAYGSSYSNGDVIGIALDLDNGKIWWSKNGTWQASGDPVAGTNPAYTGISGSIFAAASSYIDEKYTAAFQLGDLTYTPPTGFDPYDATTNNIIVTLPAITAQLNSGAICNVTLPSFTFDAKIGDQASFTIPSFTADLQTGALANVTLPSFTFGAQAHQIYYMNVNFILPCFTSNGELNSRGITGSAVLPVFTSNLGSGSQANFTLPTFSTSGDLTVGNIGDISSILPSFIFSGNATVNQKGNIGYTLPSVYSSLQGKTGKLADITFSLPALQTSGLLYSSVSVTAEITLPSFKADIASTSDRFSICDALDYEDNYDTRGSINIKLPVPIHSITN